MEPQRIEWESRPREKPSQRPHGALPPLERTLLWAGGVVIPLLTQVLLLGNASRLRWQGGRGDPAPAGLQSLSESIDVLALLPLYPLLVLHLAAFGVVLLGLPDTKPRYWARFGLLTGFPIALLHAALLLLQSGIGAGLLVAYHAVGMVAALGVWGLTTLLRRWTRDRAAALTAGAVAVFGLLTFLGTLWVIATGAHSGWVLLVLPLLALPVTIVLYGPLIWIACDAWLVGRMAQFGGFAVRFSLAAMLLWLTWTGAFFAACRYAVLHAR